MGMAARASLGVPESNAAPLRVKFKVLEKYNQAMNF